MGAGLASWVGGVSPAVPVPGMRSPGSRRKATRRDGAAGEVQEGMSSSRALSGRQTVTGAEGAEGDRRGTRSLLQNLRSQGPISPGNPQGICRSRGADPGGMSGTLGMTGGQLAANQAFCLCLSAGPPTPSRPCTAPLCGGWHTQKAWDQLVFRTQSQVAPGASPV